MEEKKRKRIQTVIVILAVLLFVSILGLIGTIGYKYFGNPSQGIVEVPDNLIRPEDGTDPGSDATEMGTLEPEQRPGDSKETEASTDDRPQEPGAGIDATEEKKEEPKKAVSIQLYSRQPEENHAFAAGNLFPGDVEENYYRILIAHHGVVTVHFRADVRSGYEKLAEVLKIRVILLTTGETLFDGAMADMPQSLSHRLGRAGETATVEEELYYRMEVYLETSVGNEYQDQSLVADFRWWVEEKENLDQLPTTGDLADPLFWMILMVLSTVGCLFFSSFETGRDDMMRDRSTEQKLTGGILVIILLSFFLCITTFALVWETVSIENNFFHTGSVEINLNDGEPIIHEDEFLFEPGMTVEKEFFIENESTWSVYYRLYFSEVSGKLADVLQIRILDGEKVLYQGTAASLGREEAAAADDVLQMKERRTLTVVFHFPEDVQNDAQGMELSFALCAEATQTKNNPNRLFD